MKKKKLEKELRKLGWYKEREGANHEKWVNGKGCATSVARHPDVPEIAARAILKLAQKNPG